MNDLVKIRLVSFGYGLLSLIAIALVGVLASPEFSELIKTNFGNSAFTGFLLLLVPEIVRHLRNLAVMKKLGGVKEDKDFFLI